MVTVVVDFETIDEGYGLFKCPSELHHDVNYQAIIKSTIIKCLLEEQDETDERNHHLNLVDQKILEEYALTNHRQTPGTIGFEETERLMLSNIEVLSNSLPTIDDLVPMTSGVTRIFPRRGKWRRISPKYSRWRIFAESTSIDSNSK